MKAILQTYIGLTSLFGSIVGLGLMTMIDENGNMQIISKLSELGVAKSVICIIMLVAIGYTFGKEVLGIE